VTPSRQVGCERPRVRQVLRSAMAVSYSCAGQGTAPGLRGIEPTEIVRGDGEGLPRVPHDRGHRTRGAHRAATRPSPPPLPPEAPPVLAVFDIRTTPRATATAFGTRLRSVLTAALRLALSHEFDGADLPLHTLPDWFLTATGPGAWEIQNWLYQFDPGSESRGWSWWDLTYADAAGREARVWVDSWGESFFGCGELRRLAHASGAEDIGGPSVVRSTDWTTALTPGHTRP
jgi:hypothetical protein